MAIIGAGGIGFDVAEFLLYAKESNGEEIEEDHDHVKEEEQVEKEVSISRESTSASDAPVVDTQKAESPTKKVTVEKNMNEHRII